MLNTYDFTAANARDVAKGVTNISPSETPLLSGLKKVGASGRKHEFVYDTLAAATSNAFVEGAAASTAARTPRATGYNVCQIIRTVFGITETQEVVAKEAGVTSEYSYQIKNAMKQHALDIEWALLNETLATGDITAARHMAGLLTDITGNVAGDATTGYAALQAALNTALKSAWDDGGAPDVIYVSGQQKMRAAGMTTSVTKTLPAGDKRLVASVDVYEGPLAGIQKIKAHRLLATSLALGLTTEHLAVAYLRRTFIKPIGYDGGSNQVKIESECTIEDRAMNAHFILSALSTALG